MRFLLLLLSVLLTVAAGLRCYTGLKLISGEAFGGEETECDKSYCYNATAKSGFMYNLMKAGCSTYRCILSRDTCRTTELQGIPVSFCCCSTDLCNGN